MGGNKYPKRMLRICQYIADHYAEPITLSKVSEIACYSPEAFCRYFKKHMGSTFVSYLNQVRIDAACLLLANNVEEKSISEIAYACGFTSVSSFNRMFKRHLGMSPTAYVACL